MLKRCCLVVAVLAMTAPAGFAAGDLAAQLDVDKDGYITAKEAEAMPEILEQFDGLDTNKDGKIDLQEIAAVPSK